MSPGRFRASQSRLMSRPDNVTRWKTPRGPSCVHHHPRTHIFISSFCLDNQVDGSRRRGAIPSGAPCLAAVLGTGLTLHVVQISTSWGSGVTCESIDTRLRQDGGCGGFVKKITIISHVMSTLNELKAVALEAA